MMGLQVGLQPFAYSQSSYNSHTCLCSNLLRKKLFTHGVRVYVCVNTQVYMWCMCVCVYVHARVTCTSITHTEFVYIHNKTRLMVRNGMSLLNMEMDQTKPHNRHTHIHRQIYYYFLMQSIYIRACSVVTIGVSKFVCVCV